MSFDSRAIPAAERRTAVVEMNDMPTLMTVSEAARFLRVSPSYLNKGRLTGEGPPFCKLGRAIRYPEAELIAWVASRRRVSTSDKGVQAA